jgi:hypothetical protein
MGTVKLILTYYRTNGEVRETIEVDSFQYAMEELENIENITLDIRDPGFEKTVISFCGERGNLDFLGYNVERVKK